VEEIVPLSTVSRLFSREPQIQSMAATRSVPGAAPSGPLTKAQRKAAAQQSTAAPLAHKGQDPNAVVVDVKSKVCVCALWLSIDCTGSA
jgi:hypothetical protein